MTSAIRFLMSLLALLAVSVALARPVCDLDQVAGNASHQQDHCASLQNWIPAVPPSAAAALAKPPAPLPLAAAWPASWRPAPRLPAADIPPDRLPITRPYHARSARILT